MASWRAHPTACPTAGGLQAWTPRPRHRGPRLLAAALAATVAFGGLAACAGSGSDDSAAGSAQAGPAVGVAEASGAKDESADARQRGDALGAAGTSSTGDRGAAAAGAVALQQRRQVRSGQLVVEVKDVDAAASNVRATVTAAQGYVQDEQTSTRPRSTGEDPTNVPVLEVDRSVLTVRVPEQSLDRVMQQVTAVGSVRARSQTSTDVTDQFVDTASRVKSQRASVDRVRTLLGRATSIGDVVRLESALSRREADLDALEARLTALDDSTTLATLAVTLERPDAAAVQPTSNEGGFASGLRDGWQALGDSAAVVLQIVGALIPFAVLVALVGLPVWLVVRRRRAAASSA